MTRVRAIGAALVLLALLLAPGTVVGVVESIATADVHAATSDQVQDRVETAAVPLAIERTMRRAVHTQVAVVAAACVAAAMLLLTGWAALRRPTDLHLALVQRHLPARAPPLSA